MSEPEHRDPGAAVPLVEMAFGTNEPLRKGPFIIVGCQLFVRGFPRHRFETSEQIKPVHAAKAP